MLNKPRILIIEDNSHASLIVERLIDDGYNAVQVDNLLDAWDCLTDDPGPENYDAIILDLNLDDEGLFPDQDPKFHGLAGWLFYERLIEKNDRLRNITIFYSSFGDALKNAIGSQRFEALKFANKRSVTLYKDIIAFIKQCIS